MRYVLTVCLLLSLGCSDDDSGGNGGVKNIAGTWSGTFADEPPFTATGTIEMTLTQDGSTITGTYVVTQGFVGATTSGSEPGTIQGGSVSGSRFRGTFVPDVGFLCDSDFDLNIFNNEMSMDGDYDAVENCVFPVTGFTTLTKN